MVGSVVLIVIAGAGVYYLTIPSVKTPAATKPTSQNQEAVVKGEEDRNTVNVEIRNFAFSPQSLQTKAGTKIVWTNKDSVGHTVTSDNGVFGSGLLGQGQSFEFVFAQEGTFSYHCTPHPNMVATVVVE